MANTNWTEPTQNTTAWARNSGIDTSVPTYNDSTVSYNDPLEYYDGYDANTITEEDVKFAAYTEIAIPANASWSDIT